MRLRSYKWMTLCGIVLILGIAFWGFGFRLNWTVSLPRGIYRIVPGPLQRDSLALICLPEAIARLGLERGYIAHGSCPGGVEQVGKRVVAMAGDVVSVMEDGVYVNGELIPDSKPLSVDSLGREMDQFRVNEQRLETGYMFVLSEHVRGWDSRYYGPVPTVEKTRMVSVWMMSHGDQGEGH